MAAPQPIVVFADKEHSLLHKLEVGIPGVSDVSQRFSSIYGSLTEAKTQFEIHHPEDHGSEPILAVHDSEYVEFVRTIHLRSAREALGPDASDDAIRAFQVAPETFPTLKQWEQAKRQLGKGSIEADIGYYISDSVTVVTHGTYLAAYWSAQCAISAMRRAIEQAAQQQETGEEGSRRHNPVYALCRPPGHHAESDHGGGFCFFNNAAVAIEWALKHGEEVAGKAGLARTFKRAAVLDVDFHHGNGTQDIFYRRPDVLMVSLHGDPKQCFPYWSGHAEEEGEGEGFGTTANYPLPPGTDWPAFTKALSMALIRIQEFKPDAIVISLGTDTAQDDPEGKFELTVEDFERMGRQIGDAAASGTAPIVVVQEGGYKLNELGEQVSAFLRGLRG